jgi:ankyrin repeat protein
VLLEQRADASATDAEARTPLHWAAEYGNTLACEALLKAGAPINAVNAHGQTALDLAVQWRHATTASFLREQGGEKGTTEPAAS